MKQIHIELHCGFTKSLWSTYKLSHFQNVVAEITKIVAVRILNVMTAEFVAELQKYLQLVEWSSELYLLHGFCKSKLKPELHCNGSVLYVFTLHDTV